MTMDGTAQHGPLADLADALESERRALLDNDVVALLASTEAKVRALRRAEAAPPPGLAAAERLAELRLKNQSNGVLLARRRREVDWALRHLGRTEAGITYGATGFAADRPQARQLAVV